jgi:selenocysteine lyase/cysteine desulfurase
VATWIGLGAALDWHQSLGATSSNNYCLDLRNYCFSKLKGMKGLSLISPENESLSTGIVSFQLIEKKNSDIYSRLKEKDIIVKVLPQHNAIRISCHVFVSRNDIDRFLAELQSLL